MIAWCSYCQQFVGEVMPYEHLTTTHVLCGACESMAENFSEADLEHALILKNIQNRLSEAGRFGDLEAAGQIIDDAGSYNLRPVDILIGVVGPTLFQIGEDWKQGLISVADEHRFTAFCENVFELVAAKTATPVVHGEIQLDALLTNALDNHHTLASRILGLWLASKGIRVRVVTPAASIASLIALIGQTRPRFLLISMALAEQTPGVIAIVDQVASLPTRIRPKVVVGGFAVKQGMAAAIPGAQLLTDIDSLAQMLSRNG